MGKSHIHIFKMGGTIEFFDPSYDELVKKLIGLDTSIDNYLDRILQPHFSYDIEEISQKDSREITKRDRKKLLNEIYESKSDNILVTHGTFTMVETAKFLLKNGVSNKKIILTGSMIPITGFTTSDAGFNLGFAIGSFAVVKPGVYLSMNGGVFTPDEIEKNLELFRFE